MSLSAIIMAGGEGSRLRPLTVHVPKPMLPLCGRPVLSYALALLKRHGMTEVGLSVAYLSETIVKAFASGKSEGVKLHYAKEKRPLGTAGGVAFACRSKNRPDKTFVVLSGDGLTDVDLTQALAFHKARGALATMILTHAKEPLSYGVVVAGADGRVERFVEKPGWGEVYSDTINTGIYLLEPEVLSCIPQNQPWDFGRDLFPQLVKEGKPVFAMVTDAYWCDIGDVAMYLQAQEDLLMGKVNFAVGKSNALDASVRVEGPCYIGGNVSIGPDVRLSAGVSIGNGASIAEGSIISHSAILPDAVIGAGARIEGAVVGARAVVGERAVLSVGAVLGDGASLGMCAKMVSGVRVWPGKRVDSGITVRENLVWSGVSRLSIQDGRARIQTPQDAALLASAFAASFQAEGVVLAHKDDPEAEAYLLAATAALAADAVQAVIVPGVSLPILHTAMALAPATLGIWFQKGEACLFVGRGECITRQKARAIESKIALSEMPQPFSRPPISPRWLLDAEGLYLGQLSARHRAVGDSLRTPMVLFTDTVAETHLASRALQVCGLQGRVCMGSGDVKPWEIAFRFGANLSTATVLDAHGEPCADDQLLIALCALGNTVPEWIVAIDAPACVETLAKAHEVVVKRVACTEESLSTALSCHGESFAMQYDGLHRAFAIHDLLTRKRTTLRGLLSSLPTRFTALSEVVCALPDRGRVLQALYAAEANAQLAGGLRMTMKSGTATVNPALLTPAMTVRAEAATMEAAEELCQDLTRRIQTHLAHLDKTVQTPDNAPSAEVAEWQTRET